MNSTTEKTALKSVHVIALTNSWSTAKGGVATINMELCRLFAAHGAKVDCLVLEEDPLAGSQQDGVNVIGRPNDSAFETAVPTAAPKKTFQSADGAVVFVVGHGLFHGPAAGKQVEKLKAEGVDARLMLVMHTDPHDTEAAKGGNNIQARAQDKVDAIRRLAKEHQAIVVSVGPRMCQFWKRELQGHVPWANLLQFDPGFDAAADHVWTAFKDEIEEMHEKDKPVILIAGRLDDENVKGFRAVMGALNAAGLEIRPIVYALGVKQDADVNKFLSKVDVVSGVEVRAKAYTTDRKDYFLELAKATMLLMPSRAEGYGLVAQDAVAVGTPVVMTDDSGFVHLLRAVGKDTVNVSGMFAPTPYVDGVVEEAVVAAKWTERIHEIMTETKIAKRATVQVRELFRANAQQSAEQLVVSLAQVAAASN